MKPQATIFTLLLYAMLAAGCAAGKSTTLYRATYQGKSWTVKTRETRTWNGSRTDWVLKLAGHPALPININKRWGTPVQPPGPLTTDWGPPYSEEIFGTAARVFLGTAPPYNNTPDDYRDSIPRQHDYTVLYMPAGTKARDFEAYAGLLKSQWAAADKALTADDRQYFPHIIGLVAAPRMAAVRRFRGEKGGVKYLLRVDPDGFVNLDLDDAAAEGNFMRHSPVQMPGKVIRIRTLYNIEGEGWTAAHFRTFRDANGQSPEAFFTLED